MADISKVTASDGTTYDLKDTTARSAIGNLATVASSGDYNDLTNKPTIPTNSWRPVKILNTSFPGSPTVNPKTFSVDIGAGLVANSLSTDPSQYDFEIWTDASIIPYDAFQTPRTSIKDTLDAKVDSSLLSSVAFSGDYSDLVNTPTIPAAQVNSDWNASGTVAEILNKPTFAPVAISGDYSDLQGAPQLATIATTGLYSDLVGAPTLAPVATSGDYGDLSNTPDLSTKQDTLVSGTNIKTINGTSILGSGNITTPDTKPTNWHAASETDRTGTDWASTPTSENIELPNNSAKSVGTFQLTAGIWIVEFAVGFNSNANGRRVMGLSTTKDASDYGGIINTVSTQAVNGANTVLSKTALLYPSTTTRYHVVAFQNRGGGLYVYPRYRAIKIL